MWHWIGIVHRNLGKWDSTFAAFAHARRLDPRDANLLVTMGDTYNSVRRYREAIEANRQALVFAPDLVHLRLVVGWNYFNWKGELDTLRAVLQRFPLTGGQGSWGQRLQLLLWERRPDSLLSLLPVIHPATDTTLWASVGRVGWTAQAQSLRGDTAAARLYYDSVVVLLTAEERANPDDRGPHGVRGLALAALGRSAEALREVGLARAARRLSWEPLGRGNGIRPGSDHGQTGRDQEGPR